MLDDLMTTLQDRFAGPPPALRPRLDGLSERWWGLAPRLRLGLTALGVAALILLPMLRFAASPWGRPVDVLVASTDLAAGTTITDPGARLVSRPSSLVPDDALTEPAGILTMPVVAGTVLTARHRAPDLPSLLRPGEVALAIARDLQPDLTAGVTVDFVGAAYDGTGRPLARGGRVLRIDASWVWVSVPDHAAAAVAAAAADQRLLVAVRAP